MISYFQPDNQRIIAVDSKTELSQDTISKLSWLFGNAELVEKKVLKGHFVGPRREMITPWSTNAVEITQNMGIKGIVRIEEFFRAASKDAPYDPMLQNRYKDLDQSVFLPLPIVSRLFGPRGVGLLVFAALGFEIVLWTLGVFLFTSRASLRTALRDLLSPPLLALLLGLLCVFLRPLLPPIVSPLLRAALASARDGLSILSGAALALSMAVAGSRFAVLPLSALRAPSVLLLSALRLLVIPLLALPLLRLLPLPPDARVILAVVAAMPAAIVSSLLAERYGGDVPFISATLLLTHLACLFTVPLVMHLFA